MNIVKVWESLNIWKGMGWIFCFLSFVCVAIVIVFSFMRYGEMTSVVLDEVVPHICFFLLSMVLMMYILSDMGFNCQVKSEIESLKKNMKEMMNNDSNNKNRKKSIKKVV